MGAFSTGRDPFSPTCRCERTRIQIKSKVLVCNFCDQLLACKQADPAQIDRGITEVPTHQHLMPALEGRAGGAR